LLAPIAAYLLSRVIDRLDRVSQTPGLLPTAVVSLVLFFAWLARQLGAPELLGGFAAGLALSQSFFLPFGLLVPDKPHFAERVDMQMRPIIYLFVPIFFVVVGLSLNFRAIDWTSPFIWEFFLALTGIALAGKLVSALLIREPWTVRWAAGLAMVPRGEVGLIFAEVGRTANIIGREAYAALVLVIAFTTVAAPLLLKAYYHAFGERMNRP
jgi:Kef-type K+ transport system membrane component KefB